MNLKHILYDWLGLNQTMHLYLNSLTEHELYYQLMIFASNFLGNYLFFPLHFLIYAIVMALILHKKNIELNSSLTKYHSEVLKAGYILVALLLIEGILIEISKRYFSLPRPFCADTLSSYSAEHSCYRSFPSGHTAYITVWAVSIWNLLNSKTKFFAICIVLWVALSRISLSMHYPADVTCSLLLTLAISLLVARHIDRFRNCFSSINYHIMKFLIKI